MKYLFHWRQYVIRNWWPTRCKFLVYLFVPNQLYMFRAMFSPIIRSTWLYVLYLQFLILSTGIAAGWCHGWDRTAFHLVRDTGRQQHRWTIPEAANTVKCSWWWAKTSPETCRADLVQTNKPKTCIFLTVNYELYWRCTDRQTSKSQIGTVATWVAILSNKHTGNQC